MDENLLSLLTILFTFLTAVGASSGFWIYMNKRTEKRGIENILLISLARDRIIALGVYYINRGWIEEAEFNDLYDGLYVPYQKIGGDGSAKKVMDLVRHLPLKPRDSIDQNSPGGESSKVLPVC